MGCEPPNPTIRRARSRQWSHGAKEEGRRGKGGGRITRRRRGRHSLPYRCLTASTAAASEQSELASLQRTRTGEKADIAKLERAWQILPRTLDVHIPLRWIRILVESTHKRD